MEIIIGVVVAIILGGLLALQTIRINKIKMANITSDGIIKQANRQADKIIKNAKFQAEKDTKAM